jgi:uncharacterized protein DUF3995
LLTKESGAAHLAPGQPWALWALWTGYAAAAWAVIFAGLSFFWAFGGRTGLHPFELLAPSSPILLILFAIVNFVVGAIKLGSAGVVVAYIRGIALPVSRRVVTGLMWFAGIGMLVYGGVGEVSDALHVSGVIHVPPADAHWFFLYLVLWDPWWILGGALVTATTWLVRRQEREIAEASKASATES